MSDFQVDDVIDDEHSLFSSLKNPKFRKLWLIGIVDSMGDQIFPYCAIAIVLSGGSGVLEVSAIMSFRVIAFFLLAPIGGVWADRLPRIRIMQVCAFLRIPLCFGIFISTAQGEYQTLYLMVFLMGAAEAFSRPAGGAIVPSLISYSLIPSANTLRAISGRLMSVGGPGIAALVIATSGARTGFLICAIVFTFTFMALFTVVEERYEKQARQSFLFELRAGWVEIRKRKWIFAMIMGLSLQTSILFGAEMVLLPVITNRVFETQSFYPMAISALSAGAIISAFLSTKIKVQKKGKWAFISWSFLVILPIALVFPVSKPFVLICYFIGGLATQPMGIFWATALQRAFPDELRGRVMSLESTMSSALAPIGMMAAGPLSKLLGEKVYLISSAIIFLTLVCLTMRVKGVNTLSDVDLHPANLHLEEGNSGR